MTSLSPTTDHLHCTICGMEWTVSHEDPDATLTDIEEHMGRRHPGPTHWHQLIGEGRA